MAKKRRYKLSQILWSITGCLLVLIFSLVVVRFAFFIRNNISDVKDSISSVHVVHAQAMTYSDETPEVEIIDENEQTLPEEETPTTDENVSTEEGENVEETPEQSEEEKTTVGDFVDKKGEEIAGLINAETGLAVTGGSVLLVLALVFILKK